jgi:hypothetical protein
VTPHQPLRYRLFTPELQWQSRGQWLISPGGGGVYLQAVTDALICEEVYPQHLLLEGGERASVFR